MRILCVDDEVLILELTVSMCRALPQAPEVVGLQNAGEALQWLAGNSADILLLDINMPEMDGITLAAKAKELQPDLSVIFLTGYSEYAVDAFRLHASGYLLKPVSAQRLAAEIDYAMRGRTGAAPSARIVVRTFGEFDVFVEGKPIVFSRARSKELLAYLVDRQGGFVTRANAFAVLWEDGLYDRSMQKQLDVVIRSLRTTLEQYGIGDIIEVHKGALRAVPEKLDCDLYRFFKGEIEAVDAYRGEYMSAYSWASLTESYMDRMRRDKGQAVQPPAAKDTRRNKR